MLLFGVLSFKSEMAFFYDFFFFYDSGCTVTVNAECYTNMLIFFFLRITLKACCNKKKTWFQQDGATQHSTNAVLKTLKEKFGQCVIFYQKTLTEPRYNCL